MAVIGVHEILLVPSLKGGQSAIGRELDKAAAPAGSRAGKTMGGALGAALKLGAGAVAGGAVAGIGTALVRGFSRLQAIEQAQATLVGLGHSAESVTLIMENANAAVKGTAFGLGDAATAAAQMVAAGVKPGEDLANTLTLIGDAATIAGVDFNSMSAIFGKAAASNKVQMDVINQLHDAGVPALQLLATQMGVTAEEASKMASKGEVDFATFEAAMTKGLGGAAQESGKTLSGAFNNSMAAIGRFGANLIQDIYPQLTTFFNGFIGWMGPVEEMGKVIGTALGDGLQRATTGMSGLWDLLVNRDYTGAMWDAFGIAEDHPLVGFLIGVHDAMKVALTGVGDFARAMWNAREGIGIAVGVISTLLIPALILSATEATKAAWKHVVAWTTKRREAVKTAWQYQKTAYAMVGHMMLTAGVMGFIATAHVLAWGQMSGAAMKHALKMAAAWVIALGPAFWIGAAIAAALAGIVALVVLNWDHIVNFTRPIWEAVAGFVVAAWDVIVGAVQAGIDWVVNLAQGAWAGAVGLFGTVWGAVSDFMRTVWETSIKPLFDGIVAAWEFTAGVFNAVWLSTLKPVFDAIGSVVGWLWQHIIQPTFYNISQFIILAFDIIVYAWNNFLAPMFAMFGVVVWTLWKGTVEKVFNFIGTAWGGLVNGIRDLWNGVLQPVFAAVGQFLMDLWNGTVSVVFGWISAGWDLLVRGIQNIWNTILRPVFEAVATVATWLWENMLRPVFTWIGEAWGVMVNGIRDFWTKHLQPVFKAVGDFINAVWLDYISPAFQAIGDAWGGMVNGIKDFWNNTLKPVLKAFGDFVYVTVVQRIKDAVGMIVGAWDSISNGFASTINWVLTHVWNNGIVKAFNNVAEAVGSDAKLLPAGLIALGDNSKKGNSKGTGGVTTAGRRAAGGSIEGGRPYLVGELGPEMIFPDRNGYVATALQTQKMLSAGRDLSDAQARKAAGRRPSEAMAPMGDGFNWGAAGSYLKDQIGLDKLLGTDQLAAGAQQLAQYAKGILDPIMNTARNFLGGAGPFGSLAADAASSMVKKVIDWATGKDSAADQAMSAGGGFGGDYTGDRSGFARPGGGPITSRFGPRWGGMHSGIDLAMPIGSAVRAAWSGVVQKAAWNALTGRTGMGMVLGHGGGRQSYYGHLSQWLASPGQNVKAGDVIAKSGNTGRSTGPHLHFEELRGGRAVNPGYLFRDQGGHLPPGLSMVLNNTGTNEHIFNQKQLGKLDAAVRGNGFPDVVTLVDESGGILTHARLIAGDVVRMDRRQTAMDARRGKRVGV